MPDVTEDQSSRLSNLFVRHNERLVKALRAHLGRYDWHLAEDLAATTWVQVVQKIEKCPAADDFAWLWRLASDAMTQHFLRARLLNEQPNDFSEARAYVLPCYAPAEDIALARIEDIVDLTTAQPSPVGVAA